MATRTLERSGMTNGDEVDFDNRDPNNLNGHVNVAFEDVLGEPEHAHSVDCLWRSTHKCFTGSKNCCHNLMSAITGLCLALCWGWTFAIVTYQKIWCITPCLKVFKIYMNVSCDAFETCLDLCLCAPCKVLSKFYRRNKA